MIKQKAKRGIFTPTEYIDSTINWKRNIHFSLTFLIALLLDSPGRPFSFLDFRPMIANFCLLIRNSNGLDRTAGSFFCLFRLLSSTFDDFAFILTRLSTQHDLTPSFGYCWCYHMKFAILMTQPRCEDIRKEMQDGRHRSVFCCRKSGSLIN